MKINPMTEAEIPKIPHTKYVPRHPTIFIKLRVKKVIISAKVPKI